jgi:hypothetical protein
LAVKPLKNLLNMKNIFLLVLILSFTQLSFCQKVSLGPELGVNIIPIENTNIGYNYQLGIHFGGHLKYHFTENFRLSTGIFITQKKKKYSSRDTSSIFEYYESLFQLANIDEQQVDSIAQSFGVNTDVLESTEGMASEIFIKVPILANYKYKNFNMYLGPYFGLLLMANKKEEQRTQIPLLNVIDISQFDSTGFASAFFPPADETVLSSKSTTENLNSLDIGMNVGIGYEMNNLHFNLMYSQGFLDYRKDRGNDGVSPLKTIRISIVYLFDLKKDVESVPSFQ